MGCTTQHMSHIVTSQEKEQHQSSPVLAQYVTSPALAAVPRGCTPPVYVPEAQPGHDVHPQPSQTPTDGQQEDHQRAGPQQLQHAPMPKLMHPADSPVPWPSRVTKGASSSLPVQCAQRHVDATALNTLCTPCTLPSAALPPYPTYPCIPCNPYPTPTSPYDQQNATKHMIQAVSSDENKVLVSDGYSWKEFNLEKIFSW